MAPMRVIQGTAERHRQSPIEAAYDHFRLDRQGNLVSANTLQHYHYLVGPFFGWLREAHPEVEGSRTSTCPSSATTGRSWPRAAHRRGARHSAGERGCDLAARERRPSGRRSPRSSRWPSEACELRSRVSRMSCPSATSVASPPTKRAGAANLSAQGRPPHAMSGASGGEHGRSRPSRRPRPHVRQHVDARTTSRPAAKRAGMVPRGGRHDLRATISGRSQDLRSPFAGGSHPPGSGGDARCERRSHPAANTLRRGVSTMSPTRLRASPQG